jgi:3-oxoacyl-[acyl-carrier protein] reductase
MGRLQDHVAVITGVSGAIGSHVARSLAREGAQVIVHCWQNRDAAMRVVAEIEAAGGSARAVEGNLSQPSEAAAVIAAATSAFGRIDILVNTAVAAGNGLILRMSDEDWQAVVNTNLTGAFYCIRAALREFVRQRKGRIINIAPLAGEAGNEGQANYVAAKASVVGLTRAVAREVGSRGITVNAVAPGFIGAGATDSVSKAVAERVLSQIPLGRAGSAADVAAAVVFLASDEAAYITGQVLNVDGGMVMH